MSEFDWDGAVLKSPDGKVLKPTNAADPEEFDWANATITAPKASGTLRRAADYGLSAVKSAIGAAEVPVGLADIVTGGRAGKLAEEAGFRPKEAKAFLDEYYSPEQKEANRKVSEAEGFIGTLSEAVRNPSTIAHTVVESLAPMGAGGVFARGLVGAKVAAPWVAGAVGEGVVGGGLAAEQIRQQSPTGTITPGQSGAALASGIGTGAFGALGGKFAGSKLGQKLGIADVDTLLAEGLKKGIPADAVKRGIVSRVLGGAFSEGVLEELPQSMQEQVWQNVATGRPWSEGVPESGAMGMLAGGVMGGAGSGFFGGRGAAQPNPTVPVTDPATGQTTEIDRTAGPLSDAAATAVETGVTAQVQAEQQEAANREALGKKLPYTEEAAIKRAEELTAAGQPHAVIPHPKREDRFAVVPQETADARLQPANRDAGGVAPGDQGQGVVVPGSGTVDAILPDAVAPGLSASPAVAGAGNQPALAVPAVLPDEALGEPNADQAAQAVKKQAQQQEVSAAVDAVAHEAATSPLNDLPQPTQAQKEAGNYKKAHMTLHGLDVAIENPQGSERSGVDRDGKPWAITMPAHYGYIKRTEGADGDQVDAYIGPNPLSSQVFVVDQRDADTGKFDEHKAIMGTNSQEEAVALYNAGFADGRGPDRMGAITPMSIDEFKAWVKEGDTKNPVGAIAKAAETPRAEAAPEAGKPAAPPVFTARPNGTITVTGYTQAQIRQAADGLKMKGVIVGKNGNAVFPKGTSLPQIKAALGAEQEIEVKERKRTQPAPDSLLQAIINRGGISTSMRMDILGDDKAKARPGLFTTKGTVDLGEIAKRLVDEDGFSQINLADETDNQGAKQLADLIRRAADGESILNERAAEAAMAGEAEGRFRENVRKLAKKYGVKTVGKPFGKLESEVMALREKRHQQAVELQNERQQRLYEAILQEAYEVLGDDAVETGMERLSMQMQDASHADYLKAAIAHFKGAIREIQSQDNRVDEEAAEARTGQGDRPGSREAGAGSDEEAGGGTFSLRPQTEADLAAKAARAADESIAARERIKRESEAGAGSFSLTAQEKPKSVTEAENRAKQGDVLAQPTATTKSEEISSSLVGEKVSPPSTAESRKIGDMVKLTKPGLDGRIAEQERKVYTVNEPDPIAGDLFPEELQRETLSKAQRRTPVAETRAADRNLRSATALSVRQAPETPGLYHTTTQLVTVGERSLPVPRVRTIEDAAKVFAYLPQFAVEHYDALVTDKNGKPLAFIGSFKGSATQAAVYPQTVMMELARIDGAAHLWAAHNHPGGVTDLSRADESLSKTFADILRGTSVEYRGLFAFAAMPDKGVAYFHEGGSAGTVSGDLPTPHRVPIVERVFDNTSGFGDRLSSPKSAFSIVPQVAKETPGVVFLGPQNDVTAFVPMEPEEMGKLRSGDRLMRLFNAASQAGGAAAIVAMPNERVTLRQYANIKGALSAIDVRTLDGISYDTTTGRAESLAEKGLDFSSGNFFSRSQSPLGNPHTADTLRAALGKAMGNNRFIPALEKMGKVRLVSAKEAIPKGAAVSQYSAGRPLAFFNPEDGITYFIHDNIPATTTKDELSGLLKHEIGTHALHLGRGDKEFRQILKDLEFRRKAGNKEASEAFRRAKEAGASDANMTEEALGYLTEAAPHSTLAKRFLAWFKTWVNKALGLARIHWKYTDADMAAMAQSALHRAPELFAEEREYGGELALQSAQAPTFYSALLEAAEQIPAKLKTGNEIALWLQANAAKLQVKKEELHWTGVIDWLQMQGKEKTSKADVAEFLKGNGVRVEEVTLGRGAQTLTAAIDERFEADIATAANDAQGDYWYQIIKDQAESEGLDWDEVSSKRDMDELLDRAMPFEDRVEEIRREFGTDMRATIANEMGEVQSYRDDEFDDTKFSSYTPPGGKPGTYRELLLTLPVKRPPFEQWVAQTYGATNHWGDVEVEAAQRAYYEEFRGAPQPRFTSSHFPDHPNPIAHLRVDEVVGANGDRLLRVVELQSDWSQKGRKEGFVNDDVRRAFDKWQRENPGESAAVWRAQNPDLVAVTQKEGAIPTAPFVTDTQAWLSLAIKKAIAYAAENGMDGVVFATGQQNADLYDLSKQVNRVEVSRPQDGSYNVYAYQNKTDTVPVIRKRVDSQADLADLLGKDFADKAAKQPVGTKRDYSGLDLKVGGEGMKAFYDKIVPDVANKVLRQIGADTKVGEIEITGVTNKPSDVRYDVSKMTVGNANQPGFLLTDTIREKISRKGLPLFSSSQIIGDSGRTYTPEQQAAMGRTGSIQTIRTPKEVAQSLWQDAGKRLAQGMVDQFRPIRDISDKAYTLMRLSKGATGAFEAFMRHGKLSLRDGAYDADTSGGVVDTVFMPLGKESTDFLRWIAGNRAERLAGVDKEHLFTKDDIEAFKSLANDKTDFDYTLADGTITRERSEIYKDSLTKFNAFNKNVLDMAEQSGLIDGASRKLWEYEFYVPFFRVADDQDGGVRGMNIKSGVIRQEAFKKLKGGEQVLNDLLENTLMNWAHLIDASAKNRAAKATLEAAENMGAAISSTESAVRAMGSSIGKKNGVVWFMDGGIKHYYLIGDPYLLAAINSLEYAGLRGPAMDAMSAMKHWLTMGVTASPFFKVRNLIRDSVQAIGTASNSGLSYNPLANVIGGGKTANAGQALGNFGKALANTATLGAANLKMKNEVTQEYVSALAGGGLIRFGTMLEGSEAKRTRQLIKQGAKDSHILDNENKVKAFYDKYLEPAIAAYNELGNRGEEINRMALYDTLIKQGVDHATASLMARDLMDFSMQGSWASIRFLTQIVPFMNARLQGLYKLGRAAKADRARFAIVLGGVSMASLALLAAYSDDDDWKAREDWDRDNYWWFKFGGTAFRIPKPFEIGAIATLAERSAELLFDQEMTGKRFAKVILKLTGDQLAMNPTPQLFKPIIDIYANKDSFTGRSIESMGMEQMAPDYRFKQSTSMAARGVSTAGNTLASLIPGADFLSPVQVDHLARAYFGWLGAFIVGSADTVIRLVSNEPTRPSMDYWKFATGSMVSELDSARSRYVTQMYEQAKEVERAHATWRNLVRSGNIQKASEYREDNKEDLKKYRRTEMAKRQLSAINERIRKIERGDASRDEKKAAINEQRKRQDAIARRLAN